MRKPKNNRKKDKNNKDRLKEDKKNNKPNDKDDATDKKDPSDRKDHQPRPGYNKAELYIPDEGLRKQVGNFSFNNVIGLPLTYEGHPEGFETKYSREIVPSVMSIGLFAGLDENVLETGSSPAISVAATKFYAKISALSGRTAEYQPSDIAIAILDIGDLCSLISNFQRAYGVLFNYNARNRDIPKALVEAMGFDYDKFESNIANIRMEFNAIMTGANNIRFPKDINYFTKCWQIYQHVFIDNNSAMSQYYVMRPLGGFTLNETGETGGELDFTKFEDKIDPLDYLSFLASKIKAILHSTTYNKVFMDVNNYIDKQGGDLIGFGYLNELFPLDFVYDETFMNQLHNMTIIKPDLSDYKIVQDPLDNSVHATSFMNATWIASFTENERIAMCGDQLIDYPHNASPTYDDNIDALAFKLMLDKYETDHQEFYKLVVPDHVAGDVKIYRTAVDGTLGIVSFDSNFIKSTETLYKLRYLQAFSVYPTIYILGTDGTRNSFSSLNFFTVVTPKQLSNIFYYYYLGLFDTEIKVSKQF